MEMKLEDLVDEAKSSFYSWALGLVIAELVGKHPTLGLTPIIQIVRFIAGLVIQVLVDKGELAAFVVNSRLLVSDQAKEYREALMKLHSLTDTVPDEEWEAAERKANEAFVNLVKFTS